ncbi:MAG TPA: hypothetical protein VEB60_00390 [Candidatus Paceibacterota bacterium]|nr:hypothetical protein [Candidatus Paceibacterota bacterium]
MKKRFVGSSYHYKRGAVSFPPPLSGLLVALALFSLSFAAPAIPEAASAALAKAASWPRFSTVGTGALRAVTAMSPMATVVRVSAEAAVEDIETFAAAGLASARQAQGDMQAAMALGIDRNRQAVAVLAGAFKANSVELAATAHDSSLVAAAGLAAAPQAAVDGVAAVVTSTAETVSEPALVWWERVALSLRVWSDGLISGWQNFGGMIGDYQNIIAGNWRKFLSGEEDKIQAPLAEKSSAAGLSELEGAKEQIRQEVEASIRQDLEKALRSIGTAQGGTTAGHAAGGPGQMLAVFPSTGSTTLDAGVTSQVKNSFSDEISVQFDETGRSGVITPVFRSAPGSNYLFILTPVRK